MPRDVIDFGRPFPLGVIASLDSGWPRPRSSGIHRGADFFVPVGTPVLAVADGNVILLQRSVNPTAGIWLVVKHDRGVVTRYLHLASISPDLVVGSSVRRGQVIAWSGATSVGSTGPHLHFDIKAPITVLPLIAKVVGEPRGGWGPESSWGYSVPVEPWLPVDRYPQRTVDNAKQYGIPLYRDRLNVGVRLNTGDRFTTKLVLAGVVTGVVAGIMVWGAYRLRRDMTATIG